MKITPIPGERLRYRIESASEHNAEHVVDMSAHEGNGECSCRFFEVTCASNWRELRRIVPYYRDERGKVGKDVTCCKHILAVRNKILDEILPKMAQEVTVRRAKPVTVRSHDDGLPF